MEASSENNINTEIPLGTTLYHQCHVRWWWLAQVVYAYASLNYIPLKSNKYMININKKQQNDLYGIPVL